MHSHNRTALSKFGFQDADRRNRRHDQACQYVAASRKSIASRYSDKEVSKVFVEYEKWLTAKSLRGPDRKVGRMDVDLTVRHAPGQEDILIHIEVKISETSIGDILAQMKFYKSLVTVDYKRKDHWLVVLDFPISDWDFDMLGNAGIDCMRLGPGFEEFISSMAKDHPVDLI